MTLDDQGRSDVFAFLANNGYTGTKAQWWAAVRAQSYASDVRRFLSIYVPSLGPEHAGAQAFLGRLCAIAQPRFNAASRQDPGSCFGITFYCKGAVGLEHCPRPLRLDGLSIDVTRDDRAEATDIVEIRCQLYVNGEFRRDRYFTFTPDVSKKRGTQ
jgi:hypothetical protein